MLTTRLILAGGFRLSAGTELVQSKPAKSPSDKFSHHHLVASNQLLKVLPATAFEAILPWLEIIDLARGDSLFEPGDDVGYAFFPLDATVVGLVLPMADGRSVEATTIGREGVIGGIVSLGHAPAFARGLVQVSGQAARIAIARLEIGKRAEPGLHDILSRYADCLTAQVLQSIACASIHSLEARFSRWLLMTHDRLRRSDLPMTQENLAELFGVARTYMTRVAKSLQRRGAISYHRGTVHIDDREILEGVTCECYRSVRSHFDRVLPGLYPAVEP